MNIITCKKYRHLSSDSKLVYLVLSKNPAYYDEQGTKYTTFLSTALSELLGITLKAITKAYKELEAAGLVVRKFRGGNMPAMIYISDIEEEKVKEEDKVAYSEIDGQTMPSYSSEIAENGHPVLECPNAGNYIYNQAIYGVRDKEKEKLVINLYQSGINNTNDIYKYINNYEYKFKDLELLSDFCMVLKDHIQGRNKYCMTFSGKKVMPDRVSCALDKLSIHGFIRVYERILKTNHDSIRNLYGYILASLYREAAA